ncbi:methyltransferase domain-containing protein [Candidatus Thorarchaeota archaeon]|nr:MAG: methyltransferase domain-containing protein [Candidatus Thorarchaeota archaeon]
MGERWPAVIIVLLEADSFSDSSPLRVVMCFQYFTDEEYNRAFVEFGGVRQRIAEKLEEYCHGTGRILDAPAGHGYLGFAVAERLPGCRVVALGFQNDLDSYSRVRQQAQIPRSTFCRVQYLLGDGTQIPLQSDSCLAVVNFLGLEDVMMTRGLSGVRRMLSEFTRVADPHGLIQLAVVEYGDLPEERVAKQVWDAIGLNAVFLESAQYVQILDELGIDLVEEELIPLNKKMTPSQAREEIRFACTEAPRIFRRFGVTARPFTEIWREFGHRIETHGMAYWSRLRLLFFSQR